MSGLVDLHVHIARNPPGALFVEVQRAAVEAETKAAADANEPAPKSQ